MDLIVTLLSFLFFTCLVGFLTWRITRHDDHATSQGYFLAGRSLTFPLIAGSLLFTNRQRCERTAQSLYWLPLYFLRPKPGKTWFGSGKEATGIKPGDASSKSSSGGDNKAILHAEQHFEYHRHPTAGDVLTAETRVSHGTRVTP